jgi:hypothetical protein
MLVTESGERLLPAFAALIKVVFLDRSLAMNSYIYGRFVPTPRHDGRSSGSVACQNPVPAEFRILGRLGSALPRRSESDPVSAGCSDWQGICP